MRIPIPCLQWPFAVLVFLCCSLHGQAQHWSASIGGLTNDGVNSVAVDASDNTYVAGFFSGQVTFGTTTVNSAGVTDVFVSKYNDQGALLWTVTGGGPGPDQAATVRIGSGGEVFVCGFFSQTADFSGTPVTSAGAEDVFVAQYDAAGTLAWISTAGGTDADIPNSMAADNSGNVAITGQFIGASTFGATTLTSMVNPSTSLSSIDVFTTKVDGAGNFLWAEQGAAPNTDRGLDIDTDAAGNVYITGQFTDNITFDNTYTNSLVNAVFVVKYDVNGVEQWFRKAGAAIDNIAYGLATSSTGDVYITGEFSGTLIFFDPGGNNTQLSDPLAEAFFLAKYSDAGDLLWSTSDGSTSNVSGRDVAVDGNDDVFVFGEFNCTFEEYANEEGLGTYNSVGYEDCFVTKYDGAGTRLWMRHTGSRQSDIASEVAVNSGNLPVIGGTYEHYLLFPGSVNFPANTYFDMSPHRAHASPIYCSSNTYPAQFAAESNGGIDGFAGPLIDPTQVTLDFYTRNGTGCNRDQVGVCINTTTADDECAGDTLASCTNVVLFASTNTACCHNWVGDAGPQWYYSWSSGGSNATTNIFSAGDQSVTITSADGCYTSSDTIYADVLPTPPQPAISDSKGVNDSTIFTQLVELCLPDSVQIVVANPDPLLTYAFTGAANQPINNISTAVFQTGAVTVTAINSDGCQNATSVSIQLDTAITADSLDIRILADSSILCSGDVYVVRAYDTISNPDALPFITMPSSDGYWDITGPSFSLFATTGQQVHVLSFQPPTTGWYVFNVEIQIAQNDCGGDTATYYAVDSAYITVHPTPPISLLVDSMASFQLCPDGSTVTYIPSGASTYTWTGPEFTGSHIADTVEIGTPGSYVLNGIVPDTVNSCPATQSINFQITIKTLPTIYMSPFNGLICPADSVALTSSAFGIQYTWYGPGIDSADTTNTIYVTTPGVYYCEVLDGDSCSLVSNTVEVTQYTTPFIQPFPTNVLCPNDTTQLSVISSDYTSLWWGPPLFSNQPVVQVTDTGTYTVSVNSCNIFTTVDIDIVPPAISASVLGGDTFYIAEGDSILLVADPVLLDYEWAPGTGTDSVFWASQAGTYTVAGNSTEGCFVTSEPNLVIVAVLLPILSDTAVCLGDSALLSAIGLGTLEWFDAATGGSLLHTGPSYQTPAVNTADTFYVQASADSLITPRVPVVVSIVITSLPVNMWSNSPVCAGDSLLLYSDFIQGATYWWTGPNNYDAADQNPIFFPAADSLTGEYKLVVSGLGCVGPTNSMDVVVLPLPAAAVISQSDDVCVGDVIALTTTDLGGHTYTWSGPQVPTFSGNTLVIDPATNGHQGVYTLSIELDGCTTEVQSDVVTVWPTPTAFAGFATDSVCLGDTLLLQDSLHFASLTYRWTGPLGFDEEGWTVPLPIDSLARAGFYEFTASTAQCTSAPDTVEVFIGEPFTFDLGNDTVVCNTVPYLQGAPEIGDILWNSGLTTNAISVVETGVYAATITDEFGCQFTDSIEITVSGCLTDVPNVFTPNGDGLNDGFRVHAYGVQNPVLYIYDRWGIEMAVVIPPAETWNGTIQGSGNEAPDGVYYWVLNWEIDNGAPASASGYMHLMR